VSLAVAPDPGAINGRRRVPTTADHLDCGRQGLVARVWPGGDRDVAPGRGTERRRRRTTALRTRVSAFWP